MASKPECTLCIYYAIISFVIHNCLEGLEAYYAKKRDLMREAEERRQYRELMKQEKGRVVHEKVKGYTCLLKVE